MHTAQATKTQIPRRKTRKRARRSSRSAQGAARWVATFEAVMTAAEQAAWDLRNTYEELTLTLADTWSLTKDRATALERERRARQAELARLLKISATVGKVVFSYRFFAIKSAFMSEAKAERAFAALHAKNGRRLAQMCEELQGGVAKVGQMLSSRTDILPRELTLELTHLLDACTPLSHATVQEIVAAGWAERAAGVSIDPAPLGSGTIGQVHRATLPDGRAVAVKVLRPEIEFVLRSDIQNLRRVIQALTPYLPDLEIDPLLDEIESQLLREVDLEQERETLTRVGELTKAMKFVTVPAPVAEWCAPGTLVTELMPGERIDRALEKRDHQRQSDILFSLAENYALQILVWGLFQPDTHPGNFLVDDDDRIVLLDFGCAREIPVTFRKQLLDLVSAFLANDDDAAAAHLGAMGFRTRSGNLKPLITMARDFMGKTMTGGHWNPELIVAEAEAALDGLLEDPVIAIPPEMVMVGRAIGTMGGMFFTYKPDVELGAMLLPILSEAFESLSAEGVAG
jgi:ubiquinone biosynthesis protein